MKELSLRERKKLETRGHIVAAAEKLFSTKGFNKTTLSDIAVEANVSPRTIFSYFASKEAIIFDDEEQMISSLIEHIDNRGDLSVTESLRTFSSVYEHEAHNSKKHTLIESSPQLQDHISNVLAGLERHLTTSIANERGLSSDSIQAHLIAATWRAVISYSVNAGGKDPEAVELAIKFIEAGLLETS